MVDQPIAHLVINQAGGGVRAHAASIGPGVAVADPLMILSRHQGRDTFSVAEDEEREFVSC